MAAQQQTIKAKPYTAEQKIRDIYSDICRLGFSRRPAFAFGRVEKRMADHANVNGVVLAGKLIYMSPKSLSHARRNSKIEKGLVVPIDTIASFPKARRNMDLYFDGLAYIYTDYFTKYIIHPNYTIKSRKRDQCKK